MTTSLINLSVGVARKPTNARIDDLTAYVHELYKGGADATIWKLDISSAFRRLVVRREHQQYTAVVWMMNGTPW